MRSFFLPLAAVLLAAAACSSSSTSSGGPHVIHASDYDTHCAAATDCAIVADGDLCGCIGCGNTAINKADVSKFDSDTRSLRSQCSGPSQICPGACLYSEVTCTAGTCGACHAPGCTDAGAPDSGADAAHD